MKIEMGIDVEFWELETTKGGLFCWLRDGALSRRSLYHFPFSMHRKLIAIAVVLTLLPLPLFVNERFNSNQAIVPLRYRYTTLKHFIFSNFFLNIYKKLIAREIFYILHLLPKYIKSIFFSLWYVFIMYLTSSYILLRKSLNTS